MNTLNWSEININTIFNISYGNKLDMCQMEEDCNGIPFVTRTASNNGIGGYVARIDSIMPYHAGCLTIALGGSIGSTFLQERNFYTSQNVAVLQPIYELSREVLIFIATLIQKESENRFVAFGRELNKHIKVDFTIKLPIDSKGTPDWNEIEQIVNKEIIPKIPNKAKSVWNNKYKNNPVFDVKRNLDIENWQWFNVNSLFQDLEKCKCCNATELLEDGTDIAYIGAKKNENGVMRYVKYNDKLVTRGNCIVFIGDGQGSVGYCLYQPNDFIGSTTLMAGYNIHLNQYTALSLVTIFDLERYRYSFGRKYNKNAIQNSRIKLPADPFGNPDWQFMEDYIKSLPYSANL